MVRYAVIEGQPEVIQRYMPGNYKVVGFEENEETIYTYIEGEDRMGWTLEDYVKPRLESGLYFGLVELFEDPFNLNSPHHKLVVPWEEA